MSAIAITVNGVRREAKVEPRQLLVYFLREKVPQNKKWKEKWGHILDTYFRVLKEEANRTSPLAPPVVPPLPPPDGDGSGVEKYPPWSTRTSSHHHLIRALVHHQPLKMFRATQDPRSSRRARLCSSSHSSSSSSSFSSLPVTSS